MSQFFFTLGAQSFYNIDAPNINILINGEIVSSLLIDNDFVSSSFFIDYNGSEISNFELKFSDSSAENNRSVQINHISINGVSLNNEDLSSSTLSKETKVNIDVSQIDHVLSDDELQLIDFSGSATIEGTDGTEALKGTSEKDIIDGKDGVDNIKSFDGHDEIDAGAGNDLVKAGAGNDIIQGGTGNDNLRGEDGDDVIYGGDDLDYIDGGNGNDFLNGGNDNDTVIGGLGNDTLFGGNGNDTLKGEDGDDFLNGGDGRDLLDGGIGNDILDGGASNDTLRGRDGNDTLFGGVGNDRLFGHDGNDTLNGGVGNDKIEGGIGQDIINGGDGLDNLSGDEGDDTINGGAGNDSLYGGIGNDTLSGGTGLDRVEGGTGDDIIHGNDDSDTVLGDDGSDHVYGDEGNDRVRGGNDNDFVFGGAGNDQVFGDAGDDEVYGGSGNDIVNGNDGNDTLFGEAGLDKIFGHEGNDIISAGDDNDRAYGNEGDDIVNGDAGNDLLYADSEHVFDTLSETTDEIIARILSQNAGLFYNDATNSFYKLVEGSFSWTESNAGASQQTIIGLDGVSGHLASINSAQESEFLLTVSGRHFGWVDGSDAVQEGTWVHTSTGEIFWDDASQDSPEGTFADWWFDGRFNALNDSYDYALFLGQSFNGEQYAYRDSYQSNYFVEWDAGDLSAFAQTTDIFKALDEGSTNIVNGGDGADRIYGSAGNDTLNGDDGNDALYSGSVKTASNAINDILAANEGVYYHADTNSFYQFVQNTLTHQEASYEAQSTKLIGLTGVEGHLAKINSLAEQNFIGTFVNNGEYAWVDGSDQSQEGIFKLSDGTILSDTLNWYQGTVDYTNTDQSDNIILWDSGQEDVLYAWSGRWDAEGYVIEWDASSLLDQQDSGAKTILNGGDGFDRLYGSYGQDIFVFDNTNGIDSVYNFDTTTGDALDISAILSFDANNDILSDFVQITSDGQDSILAVDSDGTANGSDFAAIAIIKDVVDLDLDVLYGDNALIV